MKIEVTNYDLQDAQCDVKERRKKKKFKKETQEEDINHVNGNTKMINGNSDVRTLKRNLLYDENGVIKKRKEKHDTVDSMKKETGISTFIEKSDETVPEKFKESIEAKETVLMKDNSKESDNEELEEEKLTDKQVEQLTGKYLRTSFNSTSALETLRKFVKICGENKERDVAAEYLNTGGNVLEILKILGTTDKKNVGTAATVFSAIRILLMKILAQYPQYQSSAEEACRHLINSHLSLIHSMLSVQSNAKQRKIILRLLAAMVSLGGNLPRELLAHLSLQPQVINSLVRHTKPTDSQSVRTCFIHFVLAFLVEGNVQIVRALLDKRGLLSSIFPDLIYDSKEIVNLVLTTVRTYILENSGISKTMKLHVFSTSVIQNLVCLYNWKGPNNWSKNETPCCTSSLAFLQEKEVVTDMVHNFLITLLTSYRHGIAFHDRTLGIARAKHNQLVNTVLQSLDRPWEHEKPSDLVIKVVAACPDLFKSQITLLESYIEPRVSTKWTTLMKFVGKIIESVDAETCLRTCSLELNALHLTNAIASLTIPGTILKNAIIPSLSHDSIIVRQEAVLVLIVMLKQIQRFLVAVKTVYGKNIDFSAFKNHMTECITKNVPNVDMILKVWSKTFMINANVNNLDEKDDVPEPKKHEHLSAILRLLHAYNDICPELLQAGFHVELSTLLTTLNELNDISIIELNTIRVKAIQFLLALNPTEFAPNKKTFSDALPFLISLLSEKVSTISLHAEATIKMLLNATGMFEGCSEELDIWINGFINLVNSNEKEEVTNWFVNIVKKTAQYTEKYVNDIIETEEIVNEQIAYSGGLEHIFNELLERDSIDKSAGSNSLYMQRLTSISPLLCCVLRKTKKHSTPTLLSYVSYVLVHTVHLQVTPRCLIHLAKDIHELPMQKYLLGWLENEPPVRLVKLFPSMSMMCKASSALLADTKIQLNEIFHGDTSFSFKYGDEDIKINHSLTAYEIMSLFRMATFYLTQFTERGILTETQRDNFEILLISLLYIAKENVNKNSTILDECVKFVFTHPTMLQYFSPFSQKKKRSMKSMITLTIFNVCTIIVDLCNERNVGNMFSHFKNKLFSQLCQMIEKNQRGDKLNDFETITALLEVLQLKSQDIVCLLNKLVNLECSMFITKDKSDLSIYGHIVPKLLEIACSEKMRSERVTLLMLNAEFVTRLCSHLRSLKSNHTINFDKWEVALWKYLSNFPFNIAGINTSTFLSLLSTRITGATVKLISLLIGKSENFISTFTDYITKSENIKESNIVFPIIASNLTYKWNQNFLQKLSNHYRSEIVLYLSDPKSEKFWIEENVRAVSYLIENTFDLTVCEEVCNVVLQIGDKLDMVSIHYVQILQSLFNKCATLKAGSEDPIMNLIQVLLHIITLTLKKESKNDGKLNILCEGLNNAVKCLRKKKSDFVFESLSNNHSWSQFTRFSLKLGLKDSKNDKRQVPILKTLKTLCDIAYKNDGDEEYVKTLFEMTTSHSEFVNIMLGSSVTKRDVIELLWIFMQKNKSVMALTHVPLYLAAYNATLSEADQLILYILQYYENNDINIHEFRPYLWGNAAAIHYSVKGETDMALWRQPSTSQVLNLFEREIVNNTIKYYPVYRALKNNELYEAKDIYDPSFYLPLLCFLLSDHNVVSCHKVTQSGALALAFAACGSIHSDVRMAAYTIISRYYSHLEASSSKSKLLWMRLIDALRCGIISLESELNSVRLSCLVSTFLARTSLVATQPLNPLYSPLQSFLMAKPALDVKTIPEMLQLFHSSDVEHKAHRHWILKNIRDGMKTEKDVEVAFNYVLFKMLFDFYICNLSDPGTKKLILEVIYATSKITKASILLINGHGLLPWLLEVTKNIHIHEAENIEFVINIVANLLNAILHMKGQTDHYKFMLLKMILSLKSHLSKDINISSFISYISVLQKLLTSECLKMMVTKEDMQDVLEFSKGLLGDIDDCEDMLLHGCEYVKRDCRKSDNETEVAKNCLKSMVWTWCSYEAR